MKNAIGIITRNISDILSIHEFLDNAEKNGHKIDYVLISYSEHYNADLIESIRKRTSVVAHKINHFPGQYFKEYGMDMERLKPLIHSERFSRFGMVPYGFNRNTVLVMAVLLGVDYLFFIDTDVYPYVLEGEHGKTQRGEIDFFGRHLEYLKKKDVAVTTSDYSGYYIVPPLDVKKMGSYFEGVQKEGMMEYLRKNEEHHCLNFGDSKVQNVKQTHKILGGNLGLKMKAIQEFVPFFSDILQVSDKIHLTRGEDTVLGIELYKGGYTCVDIDTLIFHDTFSSYPQKPNILKDINVKNRLYNASIGWIGRNPMLNWLEQKNLHKIYKVQRKALELAAPKVSIYLNDSRFLNLPEALDKAYAHLPNMIREYEKTVNAWHYLSQKYKEGWQNENIVG